MTTTNEDGRRDQAPAEKEGNVSDRFEVLRALLAPAMVLALVVQGVTGVTTIRDIGNTAQNAKDGLAEVKSSVKVLEANRETSTAEMAVVKSRLDSVVKLLERIDARMESSAERKR